MKRNLITQIRNEWHDNLWLVLALTIVSLAIWLFLAKLEYATRGLTLPKGFNSENVYVLTINRLHRGNPDYAAPADDEDTGYDRDLLDLLQRIREEPSVEEAALSFDGNPYCIPQWSENVLIDENDTLGYHCMVRFVNPAMVRVLGFTSRTGKSAGQLEEALKRGEALATNIGNPYGDYKGRMPEEFNGNIITLSETPYKVGDIIDYVRISEYNMENLGMLIIPVEESENMQPLGFLPMSGMTVKVKPGQGDKFVEAFRSKESLRVQRNIYLSNLISLDDAGEVFTLDNATDIRLISIVIASLLVIVALGLLGVFWFRTQQRVGEIAIRKVCGANRRAIFRRIIGEGLLLLGAASVLTAAIGWSLLRIMDWHNQTTSMMARYFLLEVLTMVIVGMMVVLSLYWPARRAMSIEPAIAIKDE